MQPPDRDTFLARARELRPRIRERAGEAEALRRLPDQIFKELKEAGLLRGFRPRRFGGAELDPLTHHEAVMEVASACPATRWFLGVIGVHAWELALFPEQAQQDVRGGDSGAQISSSFAPTGHVGPVAGGFRLRGAGRSRAAASDWVLLGGVAGRAGGVPEAWARSRSMASRCARSARPTAAPGPRTTPSRRCGWRRPRRRSTRHARRDAPSGSRSLRSQAGEPPYPLELRARARRNAANVVRRGVRAVDAVFEASGGRALFLDNPMQRFFRDVHAMRGHAFNDPDEAARLFGHAALHPGEPPLEIFL